MQIWRWSAPQLLRCAVVRSDAGPTGRMQQLRAEGHMRRARQDHLFWSMLVKFFSWVMEC